MSRCTKHFEKYEKMEKKSSFAPKWGQKLSNEFPHETCFKTRGFGVYLKVSAQTFQYWVRNRQKCTKRCKKR